ncbi:rhodanese-like domain-containing protein [Psychrobacter sp. I-STPA10]|uniref:rhodanese-like domain-containing protein n=1 Tax=Psychrobacter sp. I-STPA10 TaxID=2585769 RepID=UPI001E299F58|nr:rhodanese-like domain-containing protein [Psychrobacter sp. I-STPA10]
MKIATASALKQALKSTLLVSSMIAITSTTLTAYAQTVWVDVRSPEEFATGHVLGADNLPHEDIVSLATTQGYAKDDTLLLYCRSGHRAGIARQSLLNAGYTDVQNLGGFDDLAETGAVKVSDDNDNSDDSEDSQDD